MIFSKRLISIPAHLFFAAFSLFIVVFIEPGVKSRATIFIVILLLMALYTTIGTLGWRYVQRRGSPDLVYGYFVSQTGLYVLMMFVEIQAADYGPTTASLAIPLIVQSTVFSQRRRIAACFFLAIVASLFTIHNIPEPSRYIGIILSFVFGFFPVLLISSLIVGEERALQRSHKLAQYAAEAEELATLRERNRLAREIHDNLGHYLTAVNMQIEAALAVLDSDPARTRLTLTKAQSLTREGLAEIRRSINSLRASPIENRLLHEAILLLAEEHQAAGHQVKFTVEGTIRPCSAEIELALYRIAQEGLTNIRKHAQATRADLLLDYRDAKHIGMVLRDDGVGSTHTNGGFGLIGIRERIQLLGGELTVQTGDKQGFTLQVEIPT